LDFGVLRRILRRVFISLDFASLIPRPSTAAFYSLCTPNGSMTVLLCFKDE
jgi:hypothetical protein